MSWVGSSQSLGKGRRRLGPQLVSRRLACKRNNRETYIRITQSQHVVVEMCVKMWQTDLSNCGSAIRIQLVLCHIQFQPVSSSTSLSCHHYPSTVSSREDLCTTFCRAPSICDMNSSILLFLWQITAYRAVSLWYAALYDDVSSLLSLRCDLVRCWNGEPWFKSDMNLWWELTWISDIIWFHYKDLMLLTSIAACP